jgi:DNA/RNA-binding domain of Phe-tRNA-synthetase-like protein
MSHTSPPPSSSPVGRLSLGEVRVELTDGETALGLVVARGLGAQPSDEVQRAELAGRIAAARARAPEDTPTALAREHLRFGRYKPTGRGKPASEYLLQAAREDRFPYISNLVDACNAASLAALLPISLVDLRRAATAHFRVRRGRAGERYVFNSAGQVIELEDLLLLARLPADEPIANPVKDSMATKLDTEATATLAVVYAPAHAYALAERTAEDLAGLLASFGGALSVVHGVLTPG